MTMIPQPEFTPALTALELTVLNAAAAGKQRLESQIAAASAATRTYSGVGFMTKLLVPDALALADGSEPDTLPAVTASHPALASGAEFIVQIRHGRLYTVEAYCFEGMWPADESGFRLGS